MVRFLPCPLFHLADLPLLVWKRSAILTQLHSTHDLTFAQENLESLPLAARLAVKANLNPAPQRPVSNSPSVVSTVSSKRETMRSVWVPVHLVSPESSVVDSSLIVPFVQSISLLSLNTSLPRFSS